MFGILSFQPNDVNLSNISGTSLYISMFASNYLYKHIEHRRQNITIKVYKEVQEIVCV